MIENVLLRPIKEVVPDLCTVPTLGVAYLNVWGWTTQGDCDLLQAGVEGDLPGVADWTVVVRGQKVDFRGLHCLLHPFENLNTERTRNRRT